MSEIPFSPLKLAHSRYRSLLPSSLYLDHSHCPRARASYSSCVAVYPRDSRSRRVLCRFSQSLHSSFSSHCAWHPSARCNSKRSKKGKIQKRGGIGVAAIIGPDQSHSIQHRRRPGMVTPLARAAGRISIDPAEARCGRNLAPREGPRHCRRLRSVTTTDEPSRTRSPAFSLNPLEFGTSVSRLHFVLLRD